MCGRLTKDVEVRTGTMTVAKFSLAVDRKYKKEGEPTADFHTCVAFGKQADFCHKYLSKGTKVIVVGRLQNDNYTKQDGTKVYGYSIICDEIEFAESKGKEKPVENPDNEWVNIPDNIDEELPFN